jgi:hypothetical protein
MDCPVCGLPLLYSAATSCSRCGYGLGENGPINLPRDAGRPWQSLRTASIAVLVALLLLGVYAYFTK